MKDLFLFPKLNHLNINYDIAKGLLLLDSKMELKKNYF